MMSCYNARTSTAASREITAGHRKQIMFRYARQSMAVALAAERVQSFDSRAAIKCSIIKAIFQNDVLCVKKTCTYNWSIGT
jgi:hypothetical protein